MFAQPSAADLVWTVISGAGGAWAEFYRTPASTHGVIYQNTGRTLPTGAPLEATFKLGNTDTVRKRVTVLLHDANFSDSVTCNFWPFDTPRCGGSGPALSEVCAG